MICHKTKQNTEMSNEKHSDSEFYLRQRNASRPGWNFDKVENLLIWKNFANYKDWSSQLQLSRISFQSWDIWTLHNDIFANQEYQLR